jgi:hypothetical protein
MPGGFFSALKDLQRRLANFSTVPNYLQRRLADFFSARNDLQTETPSGFSQKLGDLQKHIFRHLQLVD